MSKHPVAHAHGSHGVVDATAAEAGLGHGEALAHLAEQRVGRHAHVVVVDEAVVTVAERLAAEADVADEVSPGVSAGTRNIDMPGTAAADPGR